VDPTRAEESAQPVPLARGRTLEGVLSAILASATDNVYAFDRDLRYIYVNDNGARVLGRPAAEIIGRTWDELFPPDVVSPRKKHVAHVVATGKSFREEILFPVNGEERYFEYVLTPVLDERGEVDLVVAIGRDTTDRKRAELALEAANLAAEAQRRRLRSLLAQAPGLIDFLRGPDLVFEFAHPGTVRALGGRELLGKPIAEAVPELSTQPDVEHSFLEKLRHVYRTGEVIQGRQARIVVDHHNEGERVEKFWDYVYLPTRDESGAIEGVMTFNVEVTDQVLALRAAEAARAGLVAAEERLRLALESAAIGTWDLNPTTGHVDADARCRSLLGLSETDTLDGPAFVKEVHATDHARVIEAVSRALEPASGGTFQEEFRLNGDRHGPERWVCLRGRALFDGEGRATRFIGTALDITEQRCAETDRARLLERAQSARAEAEKASRTKDEFLAMLGHELRNPLSPILTALQLMRLRAPDSLVKERTIIERQVHHLVGLVDDLLDVSRITGGKIELKKCLLEMSEVIGKAVEMASPLIEQRRHRLSVSVPSSGMLVDGDEQRLAQVFANLLTNAAKYTEPGGEVFVMAERADGHVVVRVRDSGMGIAPELLPRIFDLFVQSERTLDRSQGGLGLGLAIVKSLVGLHGGTVHAASHGPGKGSEMSVRLPVVASFEAGSPSSSYLEGPTPFLTGTRLRGGRRILVVDDNRDAAETLADGLRALGNEVFVAHDGPSALDLAARIKPELAFLDIGLPVMDGYELAKRLQETPSLTAISLVAVTGYGQEGDRQRSRAAGFHEHLVKPVDLSRIVSLLAALPARAEAQDDSMTSASL
jgi:PAS domain S-box-containing protein